MCKRSFNILTQGSDTSKCPVPSLFSDMRSKYKGSFWQGLAQPCVETPCVLALALKCCESLGALAVISKVFRTV